MAGPMAEVPSLLGRTLGHYRILEKIGEGGMGEVYRAHDEHLDCDVAIKVLPPGSVSDESARKRFHKEARALSRLSHPSIAIVHDFDTQQGVDYLVMEYISGTTLSEKLARGKLPEKEVVVLGMQLAEGLCAAHERGVIHSDLKPSNLRLMDDGRLKILDFGLAKLRVPVTATAATLSFGGEEGLAGTLPYMAPEQLLAGEIDARTDIHGAGSVLYEMATGQRPFAEVKRSQLTAAIMGRPPLPLTALNPTLSPELERIIGKCLEKDPENRYQSAKELAIDLRRLAMPGAPLEPRAASLPRWPFLAAAGLLLLLITAALYVVWRPLNKRVLPEKRIMLAVLPFENVSRDPSQEFFSDGVTEQMINWLGRLDAHGLGVIAATSAMKYKNSPKKISEIGRELGADYILEGSVQQEDGRVRITAQLITVENQAHVWADSYERDSSDIFLAQADVARAVAQQIRLTLTPQAQQQLNRASRVNPEAYLVYLRGQLLIPKFTVDSMAKEEAYYEQALQKDPHFALAYSALANCYLNYLITRRLPPQEAAKRTKELVAKALQMDENLGEAYAVLAYVNWRYDWDLRAAERNFARSLQLSPNSVWVHLNTVTYLAWRGRRTEAFAEWARARQLDPLWLEMEGGDGLIYYQLREYQPMLVTMRKFVVSVPGNWLFHYLLGVAYEGSGQVQQAIPEYQKAVDLSGNDSDPTAALAYAYARIGKRAEAEKTLHELVQSSKTGYVSPYMIATIYAGLGDKDRAFEFLTKAYEERSADLSYFLKADLRMDTLRSDQRFQDLVSRMGFPP